MRGTIVAACLCALALTDVARAGTVARLPNESEIRAYGGVAVVSVLDRPREEYRLARVHDDGRVEPLPGVPPRAEPFDADVGPDSRGRPVVVYSRCADVVEPRGCDLVLHRIGRRGEVPVRTASTRAANETEPTVWRGRVAWASERDGRTTILTRSRLAARTLPARRVRRAATSYGVEQLELRARLLAAVTREDDGDLGTSFLRLHDLRSGGASPRTLRRVGTGMSGATIVGPAFTSDRLGWLVACFGDSGGCTQGPSAYDLRTHRTTTERGYRPRTGYAFVRGGTLEVGGGGDALGDDPLEDPDFPNACGEDAADRPLRCPVLFRPARR